MSDGHSDKPRKSSFPKQKIPRSIRVLRRWVQDYAKETQLPERRIFRAVSFMLVAMLLERARTETDEPRFVVKGGVSMELRLRLGARETKDFDAVFRGKFEDWLEALDDVLAEKLDDFSFSRSEPEEIRETKTYRVKIAIDYRRQRWGQVQVEVAPEEEPQVLDVEKAEPFDIGQFGLRQPGEVAVVGLPYLIAQKLHACTEPPEPGEENARVHDLMDMLLARDLLDPAELRRVREACEAIFGKRATHSWPPKITIYPSWPDAFRKLADEEGFPITDVPQAAAEVEAFIKEIAGAE